MTIWRIVNHVRSCTKVLSISIVGIKYHASTGDKGFGNRLSSHYTMTSVTGHCLGIAVKSMDYIMQHSCSIVI